MGLFRKRPTAPVIDLRDPIRPVFEFGKPVPCPSCGEPGYLDGLNMRSRVMFQHCPTCFTKWETHEDELGALSAS